MQIEVKPSEQIMFKYGDKEFKINRLKVGLVRDLMKKMRSGDTFEQLDAMTEFCVKSGVPEDIVNDWDQDQLASFFNQLAHGEKKS